MGNYTLRHLINWRKQSIVSAFRKMNLVLRLCELYYTISFTYNKHLFYIQTYVPVAFTDSKILGCPKLS